MTGCDVRTKVASGDWPGKNKIELTAAEITLEDGTGAQDDDDGDGGLAIKTGARQSSSSHLSFRCDDGFGHSIDLCSAGTCALCSEAFCPKTSVPAEWRHEHRLTFVHFLEIDDLFAWNEVYQVW